MTDRPLEEGSTLPDLLRIGEVEKAVVLVSAFSNLEKLDT